MTAHYATHWVIEQWKFSTNISGGKGFSFSDIPQNPDFFFNELRKVLEFEGNRFMGSVSALGTVSILERAIIEILCRKLGVKFDAGGPIVFSEWVKKVREAQRFEAYKVNPRKKGGDRY